MKFSELLERMRSHNDKLDEQYGEILEEDTQEEAEIDQSLEDWANYFLKKSKDNKANAQAAKELAAHYTARAKMFERQEDFSKQGIFTLVTMAGKPIKTVAGSARIQQGVISVQVTCAPENLPTEYQKVSYSADKTALKAAIEAGKTFEFATLERGNPFLVIR